MARKETIVSIVDEESRDNGRDFLIVEMSAIKSEKWATKALLAIVASGADIGDDVNVNGGIQELAKVGIKALTGLKYEFVEPLMDEMMSCWHYLRTPGDTTARQALNTGNCDNYIEEVSTFLKLRSETLSIHLGFSVAGKISDFQKGQEEKVAEKQQNTKTPPDTSVQSFQEDWQQKKS